MSSGRCALLPAIEQFAVDCCAAHDPAHDIAHVRRVVANVGAIVAVETGADQFVVMAAAWLHDIVQLPKGSGALGEPARLSAQDAAAFLGSIGVAPDDVNQIAQAIETHSFSGGRTPGSLEAAILQDADRLDALGAVGIARLWATAGVLGSKLHHPDDPAGKERTLADREYGLDHVPAKLLKLPALMNTSAGRTLAEARAAYVSDHYARFLAELRGEV